MVFRQQFYYGLVFFELREKFEKEFSAVWINFQSLFKKGNKDMLKTTIGRKGFKKNVQSRQKRVRFTYFFDSQSFRI